MYNKLCFYSIKFLIKLHQTPIPILFTPLFPYIQSVHKQMSNTNQRYQVVIFVLYLCYI